MVHCKISFAESKVKRHNFVVDCTIKEVRSLLLLTPMNHLWTVRTNVFAIYRRNQGRGVKPGNEFGLLPGEGNRTLSGAKRS